jgi:hypothetical protein
MSVEMLEISEEYQYQRDRQSKIDRMEASRRIAKYLGSTGPRIVASTP